MSIKWGPVAIGLGIVSSILIVFSRSAKAAGLELESISSPEAYALTSKWTDEDFVEIARIAQRIKANPADILLVMTAESSLDPNICNPPSEKCQVIGGHPVAVGLIQFTKIVNSGIGINEYYRQNVLPTLSVTEQLPYVEKYFQNQEWTRAGNEYANAGNVYQAVFAGGTMTRKGTSLETVLYTSPSEAYKQNRQLDTANKGYINVQDLVDYMRRVATKQSSRLYSAALTRLRDVTGDDSLSPNLP